MSLKLFKAFILILLSILILSSCSPDSNQKILESSGFLDSLLAVTVKSSHKYDFTVMKQKYDNIIAESKLVGDHKNHVLSTINLGLLYLNYNAQEESLNYLLKALDLTVAYGIDDLKTTIYNNIGIIYSTNGDFSKAEEYFSKALEQSKEIGDEKKIAINLINLGELNSDQDNLEQANYHYHLALEKFQLINDTPNIAMVLNNIGIVLYKHGNYEESKSTLETALLLEKNDPNRFSLPIVQLNYGKTLLKLGRFKSATIQFEYALAAFKLTNKTEKIVETCGFMAEAYKKLGELEEAMKYYDERQNWSNTLLEEKSEKWISEIQMKYDFGKKEKEIEYLQEKAKKQKLIWGGIILAVLLFSTLLFYSIRTKNANLRQKNIILVNQQELNKLEISRNQLLQDQLAQKLEMKNRELASKAIHLLNKNEMLRSIETVLDQINANQDADTSSSIKDAKRMIFHNINLDSHWEDFKKHFEEVHTGFFSRLLEDYPTLTQTDLRLSAYIMINLKNKEIAQISNITPDSARKRKQRLKEKLNLSVDEDIRLFLNQYEFS